MIYDIKAGDDTDLKLLFLLALIPNLAYSKSDISTTGWYKFSIEEEVGSKKVTPDEKGNKDEILKILSKDDIYKIITYVLDSSYMPTRGPILSVRCLLGAGFSWVASPESFAYWESRYKRLGRKNL